ncbi:MAG TPA: adenosine deaminase [Fimbriimonadaceae bacterium]|nr:adenosine deaminase [Fimbriimonadaceae bacterium]
MRDFIRRMPKVELHVHVEGSIVPSTLLQLAAKNGVDLPASDPTGLREWYSFRDFPHFVDIYVAITKCIKTPEDIGFVIAEFAAAQAEQNILYTEATYTACTIDRHCGIPWPEQWAVLQEALRDANDKHGITINLILDIVRGDEPARGFEVLEWVSEGLGKGVCALGLAGFEDRGTKQYADVFQEAFARRVPVAAHAGETQGAWSIEETLEVTRASRIGHGVRVLEDKALVGRLRDQGTVLEVCPSSNVCLKVVDQNGQSISSIGQHPIQMLRDNGLFVTVNSDDPPLFNTTLTDEFVKCTDAFGWGPEDLRAMTDCALAASFQPEADKEALKRRIDQGWPSR